MVRGGVFSNLLLSKTDKCLSSTGGHSKQMAATPTLVALLTVVMLVAVQGSPSTGRFTAGDGSECSWFDLRLSHEQVALAAACVCKDQHGKSQSYGCQYTGDLYTCDKFVHDTKMVFEELVQQISGVFA